MTRDDRVRVAEHDITQVLVRYATGIDRRDWELFRTCFTPDCRAEYQDVGNWDGADAITEFMTVTHADVGHTLHRLSNIAISVQDDEATARTYVDAVLMAQDGASGVNALGFYDDRLVRTPDGWRISHRTFTPVHFTSL